MMKGKGNRPGDDLDRLMDEVAAELGDWTETDPPAPATVVDFQARKAAKLDKATRREQGMIGADTTKEGDEHGNP